MPAGARAIESGSSLMRSVIMPANVSVYAGSAVIDPCDYTIAPRLSKLACVYQKFKVNRLSFRYVPYVGTNQNGVITMAFLPNSDTTAPATEDEFQSVGGMKQVSLSQPATYLVDQAALNRAFTVNYTSNDSDPTGATPINTIGKFCWLVAGAGIPSAQAVFGSLYMDYSVVFSDPRISNDSNSAISQFDDVTDFVALDSGTHIHGKVQFGPREGWEVAGFYPMRMRQAAYLHVAYQPDLGVWDTGTVAVQLMSEGGGTPATLTPLVHDEARAATAALITDTYLLPHGQKYLLVNTGGDEIHKLVLTTSMRAN